RIHRPPPLSLSTILLSFTLLLRLRPPPCPPLFPYTTLFRSHALLAVRNGLFFLEVRLRKSPTGVSRSLAAGRVTPVGDFRKRTRSEEHTSELQSHLNLVCRLLLEKKKTTTTLKTNIVRYLVL